MVKKVRVKGTLAEAGNVRTVWKDNPNLTVGDVKLRDFTALLDAATELDKSCADLGIQLVGLKNKRDESVRQLNDVVTRFRFSVRGQFGPDSPQYEQSGGRPSHARKSPTRKTTNPPVSTPQQ